MEAVTTPTADQVVCSRCEQPIDRWFYRVGARWVEDAVPVCVRDFGRDDPNERGWRRQITTPCAICGKVEETNWQPRTFCSPECAAKGRRRRRRHARTEHEATCERCGTAFTATRVDARFCSVNCRMAAYRTRRWNLTHSIWTGGKPGVTWDDLSPEEQARLTAEDRAEDSLTDAEREQRLIEANRAVLATRAKDAPAPAEADDPFVGMTPEAIAATLRRGTRP